MKLILIVSLVLASIQVHVNGFHSPFSSLFPNLGQRYPHKTAVSGYRRQRIARTPVTLSSELQFYSASDMNINWNKPQARGNFGSVYYGTAKGTSCVVKCPVLDEFSLRLFDTERAVNIKLKKISSGISVPWAQMLGEVSIPEFVSMPDNVARIGIVWQKEGDGATLETYLSGGKNLYNALNVKEAPDTVLRPELCKAVMAEYLLALIQMHRRGIMHRDVKPSNTLVVPSDSEHPLKFIDFGSSCDWSDPLKRGLGDATNDPMYAAPEQTLSFAGPGKFDVFSVGMTGFRILLPTITNSGVSREFPGGRFQQFAEVEFPAVNYDLRKWLKEISESPYESENLKAECKELLQSPERKGLLDMLTAILTKNIILRPSAQKALALVGETYLDVARNELATSKAAEAAAQTRRLAAVKESQQKEQLDETLRREAEKEEEKRIAAGAVKAIDAAKTFLQNQAQKGLTFTDTQTNLFGDFIGSRFAGRSDKDIANVVPDYWVNGIDYYMSPKLTFRKGEIVVTMRSDKSRRFGKIIQNYGDDTYAILVDRDGGDGEGLYRTERAQQIGKIATGRSKKEEEEASQQNLLRSKRNARKQIVNQAKLGSQLPEDWKIEVDFSFSPTSFFKVGEAVVYATVEGSLRFGKVAKDFGDGTCEVNVGDNKRRIFFIGSLGKFFL